jgi:hypothetical protein
MLRHSSTFLYLAVFLGLICYLTFIDKKLPGTKDQEESENQLFKLDPEDVTGLEIQNVHGLFIFKKNNNHWEIQKPVDTLADSPTVQGVISQIAFAQPQRTIKVDGSDKDMDNLKEWGLVPTPAERVVIHTANPDKKYVLLVGRKTAISDSVYARASDKKNEPVRVIPFSVKQALQKDLPDFRSRNVFDFEPEKATKVATKIADTATMPGQQCELDLKNGHWSLQMPLVARASDTDVQGLLNKILGEHIVDFVTDDASNLSPYGLTSPTATLSVTIKPDPDQPSEDLVLQIGGPVPDKPDQVYAQRLKSNSVFTLTRSSVDDLLKAVPNVRDRHVMAFDPGKATGLNFALGDRKGQVEKAHDLWSTVGDAAGRADVGRVTDILAKLSQLETTPVLKDSATDLKPFGLDKPVGKITVESPEFKPASSLTLYIGKTENNLIYVRNSTEPFIYTLPETALSFLPANNLELRDARAIHLDLKDVKGMTVTVGSGTPITMTRSSGGTWTVTNVKDHMVDAIKADTQASLFCQLQASKWLGPILPADGLSKPVLTVAVQTDKPNPTVLHIGPVLPDGGHAAIIEGEPTAFEITDGDFGILNTSSIQSLPAVMMETNAPAASGPSTNAAPVKK